MSFHTLFSMTCNDQILCLVIKLYVHVIKTTNVNQERITCKCGPIPLIVFYTINGLTQSKKMRKVQSLVFSNTVNHYFLFKLASTMKYDKWVYQNFDSFDGELYSFFPKKCYIVFMNIIHGFR